MAITFDGAERLATLTAGTLTLSVHDIYSRWKDFVKIGDNAKYAPMFSTVGGDPIDQAEGTSIPLYAFLANGWRVRPQEASHTLKVQDGILLVGDGISTDPFLDTLGAFVVRINYQQPVQAITVATGGGSSPGAIADAVWDEVLTGATHNVPASAGRRLRTLGILTISDGDVVSAAPGFVELQPAEPAQDRIYNGNLITISEGTGVGQTRIIIHYDGTTKIAYIQRYWDVTPDVTSKYIIQPQGNPLRLFDGRVQGATATTIDLMSDAPPEDDILIGSKIVIYAGPGDDQSRIITGWDGALRRATIDHPWYENPTTLSGYVVFPIGRAYLTGMEPGSLVDLNTANARLVLVEKILRNKTITDPVAGTITVFDNDGIAVLFTAPLFEDAAGTEPYKGQGAERRERLE